MSPLQQVEVADFAVYSPTSAPKLKHKNVTVKHLFMAGRTWRSRVKNAGVVL